MEGDNDIDHIADEWASSSGKGMGFGTMTRRRKNRLRPPAAFLVKTFKVVEDPATDEIISWNAHGTAFVVWQPAEYARDLLPTLFKHSNFSSFVRQLNTYGFRKVTSGRWEFFNDMFRKGSRELLCHIRRRKPCTASGGGWKQQPAPPPQPSSQRVDEDQRSSSSTSSATASGAVDVGDARNQLEEENRRLREENGVLASELCAMKKKCRELLDLAATCTVHDDGKGEKEHGDDSDGDGDGDGGEMKGPKLFGVTLEVRAGGERPPQRKRKTKTDFVGGSLLGVLLSQYANK